MNTYDLNLCYSVWFSKFKIFLQCVLVSEASQKNFLSQMSTLFFMDFEIPVPQIWEKFDS